MDINDQMRADWNRRAREDANFYVAFGRRNQEAQEFLDSAAEVTDALESEFSRLPPVSRDERKALEIGCGPGRLMRALSRHFGEIHGVDISDEMIRLATEQLRDIPHARAHVTPDSTLGMFQDGSFDFVYSYIVFQHIPDRNVVLNYLRESKRVLKPGGILRCQLRGTPPLASEMGRENETWTGCYFTGEDLAAFAREHHFQLVALSGLHTQYMWITLRKPLEPLAEPNYSNLKLKAVTAAGSGRYSVPQRGREAAVSLWIEGMPESGDLAQLGIGFDGMFQQGCYISPVSENGGCQLDAVLPRGVPAGSVPVTLCTYDGRVVGGPVSIEVTPGPPWEPKVLSVSDGINILSKNRTESGGVKVTIQDIEHPDEVSFLVGGQPVRYQQFECKDPLTYSYEFAFYASPNIKNGEQPLDISISGRVMPPITLQVQCA